MSQEYQVITTNGHVREYKPTSLDTTLGDIADMWETQFGLLNLINERAQHYTKTTHDFGRRSAELTNIARRPKDATSIAMFYTKIREITEKENLTESAGIYTPRTTALIRFTPEQKLVRIYDIATLNALHNLLTTYEADEATVQLREAFAREVGKIGATEKMDNTLKEEGCKEYRFQENINFPSKRFAKTKREPELARQMALDFILELFHKN